MTTLHNAPNRPVELPYLVASDLLARFAEHRFIATTCLFAYLTDERNHVFQVIFAKVIREGQVVNCKFIRRGVKLYKKCVIQNKSERHHIKNKLTWFRTCDSDDHDIISPKSTCAHLITFIACTILDADILSCLAKPWILL